MEIKIIKADKQFDQFIKSVSQAFSQLNKQGASVINVRLVGNPSMPTIAVIYK